MIHVMGGTVQYVSYIASTSQNSSDYALSTDFLNLGKNKKIASFVSRGRGGSRKYIFFAQILFGAFFILAY